MNRGTDAKLKQSGAGPTPEVFPLHRLRVALVEPDIPQNTGNIALLCAVTGVELHLVRPLGFFISDSRLRRSGMDYWQTLQPVIHDDVLAFEKQLGIHFHLFSARGRRDLWNVQFSADDFLVFGSESKGLPTAFVEKYAMQTVRIPMQSGQRCLNVSTSAGIAVYEALRQVACGEKCAGAAEIQRV